MALKLRQGWYLIVTQGFDLDKPGIYEWRIGDIGLYVGKAKRLRRRIRDYPNNIRRMIEGLPWHGNDAKQYRGIHYELRTAYDAGVEVRVQILENCLAEDRAFRERAWIAVRRQEQNAGGPRVLNAV